MADSALQRIGNYHLIRPIGQGAFARVYLGEHMYLQTQAAIKVVQMQLASNSLERFLAEARIIAHLRHPSIVGLLEFGVDGTTPFLVMDYAPHGSLRQRHPKGSRVPLTDVLSYVKQIASGLQYAHDEKLIHRDIKPENLLLGEDDEVLLADFGIALIAQTYYQKALEVAGTPAYMAPEQLQGKPRRASDQYALGIIVYEWLTGSCPFQGSFAEIITHHMQVPPPSLRDKDAMISPAVEAVVMTALAKDPERRFASMQAFANALEQACQLGASPLSVQLSNPQAHSSLSNVPAQAQLSSEGTAPQLQKSVPQQPLILSAQQKPRSRRGPLGRITTLLIVLTLLIIGGSGLFYYTKVVQPAMLQVHATATPKLQITTSSPTQIYTLASRGTPYLDSTLNENNSSWSWTEATLPQGGGCGFRDGAYYATILQKDISMCLAQATVSDFTYQVNMTITMGDEGGLIFRSDDIDQNHYPSSTNYYLFSITPDGHYSLSYRSDKPQIPLTHGTSLAIKIGLNRSNLLTVVAQSSKIYLYVNKQFIASISDSRRNSGLIGVFAQDDGNPTDIAFSNVQLWML